MSATGPAIPSIGDLTASAARLLQQSLAQAAQAATPQVLSATDLALARSNVAALAFVQGMGLHGAYRYLRDFNARQAVPIWSAGEFLDGWLATYGMVRKVAAPAGGVATGTGVDGAVLPAGALLQAGDARQYRVVAAVAVAAGVVAPQLVAVVGGAAGNAAAVTALQLVTPVVGIDATFAVGLAGLAGGAETETDAQAVYRLQQRLSAQPMGGCPADYARWALEVPGITRAWGVRNPAGPTTAGVLIMADTEAGAGLPSVAQRNAVYDYIRDPRRGPPDELFVVIPTAVPVNLVLAVEPNTAATRAGTLAALQDLFFREAAPGTSLPHSHVAEAISGVVGEYNHEVISPVLSSGALFLAGTFDHLLTLGTVEFA